MGDMQFNGTPEEWDALVKKEWDALVKNSKQKQLLVEVMNEDDKDGLYKQMTAVDWLNEKLVSKGILFEYELIKQAKQMEKEQHGKTWDKALDAYEGRGHLYVRAWQDFDEYYNETYNK